MPNITVKMPLGLIPEEARPTLAAAITRVVEKVEQIGDDPSQKFLTWIAFEELGKSCLFAGGADPTAQALPIIVTVQPPEGVIDDGAKQAMVAGIDRAIRTAVGPDEKRVVATSIIVTPVPDGDWGVNGQIMTLPKLAKAAGYKHLQHLV